jgi:hypothetical protein
MDECSVKAQSVQQNNLFIMGTMKNPCIALWAFWMLTLTQVVQCYCCWGSVSDEILPTSAAQGRDKYLNRQRTACTNIFARYRVDSGSTGFVKFKPLCYTSLASYVPRSYEMSAYCQHIPVGTERYWLLVAVLTVQFVPHRKHTPSP